MVCAVVAVPLVDIKDRLVEFLHYMVYFQTK